MITVAEATDIIHRHLLTSGNETIPLSACVGRVLAESVAADRDLPPFHRVAMDGIALAYESWRKGRRTFVIAGMQVAGEVQKGLEDPEACMEVMTGAVLPSGCDTVIRYEDLTVEGGRATVNLEVLPPWQSVHKQGADALKGDVLLERGQVIAPSEVALMAAVGKSQVRVVAFPRVAIISTGDELVDIDDDPAPFQIRRSNAYALQAALRQMNCSAAIFHIPDDRAAIDANLSKILVDSDVLILSGGVSKGKFDFIPEALEAAGIRKRFHQVSQRPGKPFWFGSSDDGKVAFALPGNPVSTFMCFHRYVKPWMLACMGAQRQVKTAILAEDFSFGSPLTLFLQVSISLEQGRLLARPVPGGGSGDFANLRDVTGFLELPLEKTDFRAGEVYPYFSFRG